MPPTEPVAGLPLRPYLLGLSLTAATGALVCLAVAVVVDDVPGTAATASLVGGLVIGVLLWGISRGQVSHRRVGLARVGPPCPEAGGLAARRGVVVGGALVMSLVAASLLIAALPGAGDAPPTIPMVLFGLAVWQGALVAQEGREVARDGHVLHTHGGYAMSWRTRLLPDRLVLVDPDRRG